MNQLSGLALLFYWELLGKSSFAGIEKVKDYFYQSCAILKTDCGRKKDTLIVQNLQL